MPSINGGSQFDDDYAPQEWNDPKPVKENSVYAPDPNEKFDYQNMDVKLYLALRNVLSEVSINEHHNRNLGVVNSTAYSAVEHAMHEFEQSFGPIPDWAIGRNWSYELVPGAQLCTKDGRKTGNAHIIKTGVAVYAEQANKENPYGEFPYFHCLTDAGGEFKFSEAEILGMFYIGDWLSDPQRVIKDFDSKGLFKGPLFSPL